MNWYRWWVMVCCLFHTKQSSWPKWQFWGGMGNFCCCRISRVHVHEAWNKKKQHKNRTNMLMTLLKHWSLHLFHIKPPMWYSSVDHWQWKSSIPSIYYSMPHELHNSSHTSINVGIIVKSYECHGVLGHWQSDWQRIHTIKKQSKLFLRTTSKLDSLLKMPSQW